jgi:hypothetical protein
MYCCLTLAGFEPALGLVDHVDAAFAAHDTAITVPVLERAKRISDLHGSSPDLSRRVGRRGVLRVLGQMPRR